MEIYIRGLKGCHPYKRASKVVEEFLLRILRRTESTVYITDQEQHREGRSNSQTLFTKVTKYLLKISLKFDGFYCMLSTQEENTCNFLPTSIIKGPLYVSILRRGENVKCKILGSIYFCKNLYFQQLKGGRPIMSLDQANYHNCR